MWDAQKLIPKILKFFAALFIMLEHAFVIILMVQQNYFQIYI